MTSEYRAHLVSKMFEIDARYARAMAARDWDAMSECSTLRAVHLDGLTPKERREIYRATMPMRGECK